MVLANWLMPLWSELDESDPQHETKNGGDTLLSSIRLPLIKQIDSGNISAQPRDPRNGKKVSTRLKVKKNQTTQTPAPDVSTTEINRLTHEG